MIELDLKAMALMEPEGTLANSQTSANLESLTMEVNLLTAQIAQNAVLIGRKLNEMKQLLPHGEFMPYIEEHCGFKQRIANQFMRIAAEYTVESLPTGLGISKVYELLALPAGEREEFIATHDAESMTVRQLREEIRRKKQELEASEARCQELQKQLDDEIDFSDRIEIELKSAKDMAREAVETKDATRAMLEAARENLAYSDQQLRDSRTKIVSLQRAYDHEKEQREALVEEGHKESARVSAMIAELDAAKAAAEAEVEKLRQESSATPPGTCYVPVEVIKEVPPADYDNFKRENESLKERLSQYERSKADMNSYVDYLMGRVDDAESFLSDIVSEVRGIIANNRLLATVNNDCFQWLNHMVSTVEGYVNDIRTSITAFAAIGGNFNAT